MVIVDFDPFIVGSGIHIYFSFTLAAEMFGGSDFWLETRVKEPLTDEQC